MCLKSKSQIRHYIKNLKRQLSLCEIDLASKAISDYLFTCPEFKEANTIFLYAALKTEVQTKYIDELGRKLGKVIAYPKIEGDYIMNFYRVEKMEHLIPCQYGNMTIYEPDISLCEKIIADKHTLIIVPGLAFDYQKNRVGYGGGYYDHYLSTHEKMSAIGICMQFQLVDHIDTDEYDEPVDKIILDTGIIQYFETYKK